MNFRPFVQVIGKQAPGKMFSLGKIMAQKSSLAKSLQTKNELPTKNKNNWKKWCLKQWGKWWKAAVNQRKFGWEPMSLGSSSTKGPIL